MIVILQRLIDFVEETPPVLSMGQGCTIFRPLHWITFNKDTNTNSMWRMIATACWNDRGYQLKRTRRVSSWGRLMMHNDGVVYSSLWISIIKVATVTVTSLISTSESFLLAIFEWPLVSKQYASDSYSTWMFVMVNVLLLIFFNTNTIKSLQSEPTLTLVNWTSKKDETK